MKKLKSCIRASSGKVCRAQSYGLIFTSCGLQMGAVASCVCEEAVAVQVGGD